MSVDAEVAAAESSTAAMLTSGCGPCAPARLPPIPSVSTNAPPARVIAPAKTVQTIPVRLGCVFRFFCEERADDFAFDGDFLAKGESFGEGANGIGNRLAHALSCRNDTKPWQTSRRPAASERVFARFGWLVWVVTAVRASPKIPRFSAGKSTSVCLGTRASLLGEPCAQRWLRSSKDIRLFKRCIRLPHAIVGFELVPRKVAWEQ